MNKKVLCALIGLVGATNNNGKTEQTDEIIKLAILGDDEKMVETIHQEKFKISPGCETCQFPCGNTSDYDIKKLEKATEEIKNLKDAIIEKMMLLAKYEGPLNDLVYKSIAYLGYDLSPKSYQNLLEEIEQCLGK